MILKNDEITKHQFNNFGLFKEIIKVIIVAIVIVALYTLTLIMISLKTEGQTYLFGFKVFIVDTESMENEFETGDLIIVEKCDFTKLKIGDIITYTNRGQTITHRIISIDEKLGKVKTKGDSNPIEDIESIGYDEIEGIYVAKIAKFEFIEYHLKHGILWALIIMIVLTLILHNQRLNRKKQIRRRKKKIEDKKNREA